MPSRSLLPAYNPTFPEFDGGRLSRFSGVSVRRGSETFTLRVNLIN